MKIIVTRWHLYCPLHGCQLLNETDNRMNKKEIFFTGTNIFHDIKFFGDYSGTGGGPEHWRKLGIDWFFCENNVSRPALGEQIWKFTQQIGKCKFDNLKGCLWKLPVRKSMWFNSIQNISNMMDKCLVKTNWGWRVWLTHNKSDYPWKDQSEREGAGGTHQPGHCETNRTGMRRHWDAR